MITVIGIFESAELAGEVSSYLLANGLTSENVDVHTHGGQPDEHDHIGNFFSQLVDDDNKAEHFASLARNGSVVTVHAQSTREAQEAADALNNYGAIDVNVSDDSSSHSQLIERIIADNMRLRG
ncbi:MULTISPECIES: hypothetical protein [unclassified Mucilaginibacter]|uniref:hypothetical protein n=1 Tax=unclassified Mucilaginibacter TaxID=2617802 RepID=UPI002AC8CB7C|nr:MULTISPECIES: hypothetical protein [unclassified Mucilaginibacter]MEB0262073.1 hypothetical protein [Mucilaginibacter sp. 10I4]MEB0278817.1 hypothetical protein [Mucilaginibacter sp. 10B2]MEB0299818.1 hypothetical protein [Mucilaginibacter sp. 5C4]WPX21999.1 hypothetical protein RHM67_11985 [Mucilaginibacter sp. 5C4]